MIESAAGAISAAPSPCRPRSAISISELTASPASSDAVVKTTRPDEEDALAPDQIARAAAEQQKATEDERVGVDDPLEVRLAQAQIGLDGREGDVDDRRVEDDHELREADQDEDDPGIRGGSHWVSDRKADGSVRLRYQKAECPVHLVARHELRRALRLRKSPAIKEYREWRKFIESLALGRRASEQRAEVEQVWSNVERALQRHPGEGLRLSWSVEAAFLVIPVVKAKVEGSVDPTRLYSWTLRNLAGHRYQKLMMRMKVAHNEYTRVDAHLRRLWRSTAAP